VLGLRDDEVLEILEILLARRGRRLRWRCLRRLGGGLTGPLLLERHGAERLHFRFEPHDLPCVFPGPLPFRLFVSVGVTALIGGFVVVLALELGLLGVALGLLLLLAFALRLLLVRARRREFIGQRRIGRVNRFHIGSGHRVLWWW
jgi:hypothetical protein